MISRNFETQAEIFYFYVDSILAHQSGRLFECWRGVRVVSGRGRIGGAGCGARQESANSGSVANARLNACKATRARVAKFELFQKLTQAIGAGWGDSFSMEQVRYERILLLFDPDADGIHCGALMTMFFYRWMRPLLDSQRIVIVHAPLIKLTSWRLKNPAFAYTEDDYQRAVRFFKENGISDMSVRRFRGLASLDEETLARSCLRPETRRSSIVTVADAESAIAIFGPSGLRPTR